ncbi:A24 family peptidase [Desulfogranum mediterraneum]|uniref:A24 family peptidase n=1 Tax=Desulfogranum mediterraneum TaxID=160661 RepID=UPI00068606CA|nr:A24 family peptidase [Desulfogranum mediterraneum]
MINAPQLSTNPLFFYFALLIVLFICAVFDYRFRRIPNFLTFPTLITAITFHFLSAGTNGLLFSTMGMLTAFALFLIPYATGGMGAGDVKLMSAVGAALGWKNTLISILFITLTGGVIALLLTIRRKTLKRTLRLFFSSSILLLTQGHLSNVSFKDPKLKSAGVPYGVAIATGVYLFFTYSFIATAN